MLEKGLIVVRNVTLFFWWRNKETNLFHEKPLDAGLLYLWSQDSGIWFACIRHLRVLHKKVCAAGNTCYYNADHDTNTYTATHRWRMLSPMRILSMLWKSAKSIKWKPSNLIENRSHLPAKLCRPWWYSCHRLRESITLSSKTLMLCWSWIFPPYNFN